MKYVKNFEQYSYQPMNEEILGFGAKTYILKAEGSDKAYTPSKDALSFIKFVDGKVTFVHPSSRVCYNDFMNLYKKKFGSDLDPECIVKCVQASYDFQGGVPKLSALGFEFNPKNEKEKGSITVKIDPNGKGLFSGTGVSNW